VPTDARIQSLLLLVDAPVTGRAVEFASNVERHHPVLNRCVTLRALDVVLGDVNLMDPYRILELSYSRRLVVTVVAASLIRFTRTSRNLVVAGYA
jgi:hypothetical protein